jgi:dTDP-4-amino-4,6-dideoxygalactose transaminase
MLAARYRRLLMDAPGVEVVAARDPGHVYHLFVVRVHGTRDERDVRGVRLPWPERERRQPDQSARTDLQTSLASGGIETLIHYPVPIPRQPALAGAQPADCPVALRACDEVLSLPLYPGLSDADVDMVAASVRSGSAALVRGPERGSRAAGPDRKD